MVTCDGAVGVLSKHEEQHAPGEQEAGDEHGEVEPAVPQEQQDATDEQQGGTEQLGQGGDCLGQRQHNLPSHDRTMDERE